MQALSYWQREHFQQAHKTGQPRAVDGQFNTYNWTTAVSTTIIHNTLLNANQDEMLTELKVTYSYITNNHSNEYSERQIF